MIFSHLGLFFSGSRLKRKMADNRTEENVRSAKQGRMPTKSMSAPNPDGAPGIVPRKDVKANRVATGTTRMSGLIPFQIGRAHV